MCQILKKNQIQPNQNKILKNISVFKTFKTWNTNIFIKYNKNNMKIKKSRQMK